MKNLLIALVALFTGEAQASNILYQQSYASDFQVSARHELVIRGKNAGADIATLVVRIDDAKSKNYASRINEEWVVKPGPFTLHLPVASFQTARKRKLDLAALTSLTIFTPATDIHVLDVQWQTGVAVAPDVLALDFGPKGSAVFPGFEPVDEMDDRLSGRLEAVERPYLDALVADGVRGIEQIAIPAKPGEYQLTLWTEDIGQWETPPRYIERRIKINGRVVLHERFSERDWRAQRYLQNAENTGLPSRGRPITFPVTVGPSDHGIEIALAGDNKTALFVSGLLLEKGKIPVARDQINLTRRHRYEALWPILDVAGDQEKQQSVDIKPTGIGELSFYLRPGVNELIENVELSLPKGITGEVRFAQQRLTRPDPQKRLLYRDDSTLRGDVIGRHLLAGKRQKFHVLLFASGSVPIDQYVAQLTVNQHDFDFVINVLDRLQPPLVTWPRYRGVYLDHAYYLTNSAERRSQLWCDVTFLAKLGFSTIAPPFSLEVEKFKQDYDLYRVAGFNGPILVYAALKRWIEKYGVEGAAKRVQQVIRPNLVWSIADEPSNPGMNSAMLKANIEQLRKLVPSIRLAGHLNSNRDIEFVDLFDVVLVNAGFVDQLDEVPPTTELWFYNVQRPDGTLPDFVAKTVRASGLLQWHARNPLGDPFDPTDGREGDKSFLLPSKNTCDFKPSLTDDLLRMLDKSLK